jgi:hypothetical protein
VLRLAVLRGSEVRVSLDVVLVILAHVLAVLRGAVLRCAVLRAVSLDVIALVLATVLRGAVLRGVMLVALDVLVLVDLGVLWPLFHLNCLLFDLLNLHTRRRSLKKSSRRRFKNAMAADILPA